MKWLMSLFAKWFQPQPEAAPVLSDGELYLRQLRELHASQNAVQSVSDQFTPSVCCSSLPSSEDLDATVHESEVVTATEAKRTPIKKKKAKAKAKPKKKVKR